MSLLFWLVIQAHANTNGYALIMTNNRSMELSRPDLRYADDDGVQYARFFSEAFGAERVQLLTELDADTRRLHTDERVLPPTREQLRRSVAALSAQVQRDVREGEVPVVYLVLAGHGDVAQGHGFLELQDGRLSDRMLDDEVLAPLALAQVHLVIDSCNSYFMINPRKPGGKRWRAPAVNESLGAKHPRLGVILSTSAEAVTYEWSEIQSGIFSYLVRSGLRGGADVDADGTITYAEMHAFITSATEPLVNDLYRPKIYAKAPSEIAPLYRVSASARRLQLPAAGTRRLTIRDRDGVRVLDVNKEDGTELTLALPRGREPLVVYEHVEVEGRAVVLARKLPELQSASLDTLSASETELGGRGEAPVFDRLFAAPFGKRSLEGFLRDAKTADLEPGYGVSMRDVQRLSHHLVAAKQIAERDRKTWSAIALGGAALYAGLTVATPFMVPGWEQGLALGLVTGSAAIGVLASGIALARISSVPERIEADYRFLDVNTTKGRSRALVATEERVARAVRSAKTVRKVVGSALLAFGAGQIAASVALGLMQPRSFTPAVAGVSAANGALLLGSGVYVLTLAKSALEALWESYLKGDPSEPALSPEPVLLPSFILRPDGASFGLSAQF